MTDSAVSGEDGTRVDTLGTRVETLSGEDGARAETSVDTKLAKLGEHRAQPLPIVVKLGRMSANMCQLLCPHW